MPSAASETPRWHAKEVGAQEQPVRTAAHGDVIISFGPDPRHAQRLLTPHHLESPSGYSAVNEGAVTVEARVEGRDADGQRVAISAAWNAADPSTVEVVPAEGSAVKVTVKGAGQSNLTVVGPGFTKDLWISATAHQGRTIQVDISQ